MNLIFAIETTCDETSIALIKTGRVVAIKTASQISEHTPYGGVVPELASRLHLKNLYFLTKQLINEAKARWSDVGLIAYAAEPGLIGCLHQGKVFAETLALSLNVPLESINHLEAHAYSAQLKAPVIYPALALVVSGGHTNIYYLKNIFNFKLVGMTLDDAAGECLDKVGRALGLSYPAGPTIEKLALKTKHYYQFNQIRTQQPLDFSFSGLKANCFQMINEFKSNHDLTKQYIADMAGSLQKKIVDELINKLKIALTKYPEIAMITLGGGVSANQSLRQATQKMLNDYNDVILNVPDCEYATDNAAMIGILAANRINNKMKK